MTETTLCAILKNEARYVDEWVAYHRTLGFDRIVLYDNASTDGTTERLQRLQEAGLVSWHAWPDQEGVRPQHAAYADALGRCATRWLMFLDGDEFLVLHRHDTVETYLDDVAADPAIEAVAVNWKLFGSAGAERYEPRPVTDRFVRCAGRDDPVNFHVKSFVRPERVVRVKVHAPSTRRKRYVDSRGRPIKIERIGHAPEVTHTMAQVNHYVLKSREEFAAKRDRGRATRTPEAPDKFRNSRSEPWFWPTHDKNEERDVSARRVLVRALVRYPELVTTPALA